MFICAKCLKEMIVEKVISLENFDNTKETMNGYVLWCKVCDIRIINGWTLIDKFRIDGFQLIERRQIDERNNFS